MKDPNQYIPDLTERFPDEEVEQVCECCGNWPCTMDEWENYDKE